MTKYMLLEDNKSILDTETGVTIPVSLENRHYKEYLDWCTKGNIPIPSRPSEYHTWTDAGWVENIAKKEDIEARRYLKRTDRDLSRVVEDIIELLGIHDQLPMVIQDKITARIMARKKLL